MSRNANLTIEQLEYKHLLSGDPMSANQWYLPPVKSGPNTPIVAIVDSGLDFNHPDLIGNIWTNPNDPVDGIDNDKNGKVDDIHGWDFVENDNSPQDGFYHGTHVAGIIGAVSNNDIGVRGVATNVRLLPIRFQNNSGGGYLGAAIASIDYATGLKLKGHNICAINLSWIGGESTYLYNAIKRASDAGIVVVIAAGNNGSNNDMVARYPSSYSSTISNAISVASYNQNLALSAFSNYGKSSVDVAAPGGNILSTVPANQYGYISGTSMAAPYVSATVAILRSMGNYTAEQIKYAITSTSIAFENLKYGLVNVGGAVSKLLTLAIRVVQNDIQEPEPLPVMISIVELSKKRVVGNIRNNNGQVSVQVRVNGQVAYTVEVGNNSTFTININKKLLTKKSNKIEVFAKSFNNEDYRVIGSKMVRK